MKDIEVPGEKPVTLSQKAVSSTIIPQKLLLPHWMELNHRFTTFLLQTYWCISSQADPSPPFFSYRLVKTCFNKIFSITSLSSLFLPCCVIFALNYALVTWYFSNKLFWNPFMEMSESASDLFNFLEIDFCLFWTFKTELGLFCTLSFPLHFISGNMHFISDNFCCTSSVTQVKPVNPCSPRGGGSRILSRIYIFIKNHKNQNVKRRPN